MANVLEAAIRYIAEERAYTLESQQANDELVITLRLAEPASYHATLEQVTAERPPRVD
ncbi:MAG: hypothetical protein R3C39_08180 [Dehalococcoidia bacterium]